LNTQDQFQTKQKNPKDVTSVRFHCLFEANPFKIWPNVMLRVRKPSQKFCTRTFAYYVLTEHETTNFGTGAFYVLVRPLPNAASL